MFIFLSYRRDDSQSITGRIEEHLQRNFGEEAVYLDTTKILPGEDFVEHIKDSLSQCDIGVAILGQRWRPELLSQEDDFVRLELEAILARGIPLIPVLVEGAALPRKDDLPGTVVPMLRRQALRIDSGSEFLAHIQKLVLAIKHLRKRTERPRYEPLERSAQTVSTGKRARSRASAESNYFAPMAPAQPPALYGAREVRSIVQESGTAERNQPMEPIISEASTPSTKKRLSVNKPPLPSAPMPTTARSVQAFAFYDAREVCSIVQESGTVERNEGIAPPFLLFQTKTQRTWLVAAGRILFCILDDAKARNQGHIIRWEMPLSKAEPVRAYVLKDGRSVVDIGERREWLYSRNLHPNPRLLEIQLRDLLQRGRPTHA